MGMYCEHVPVSLEADRSVYSVLDPSPGVLGFKLTVHHKWVQSGWVNNICSIRGVAFHLPKIVTI